MSYFPKDEAEYAADRLFINAKELQDFCHNALTDSLDIEAIQQMMTIMGDLRENVEMMEDWIERMMK